VRHWLVKWVWQWWHALPNSRFVLLRLRLFSIFFFCVSWGFVWS
jgi:hypothetical protein